MIFLFGGLPYLIDLPAEGGKEHDDVVFLCQSFDQFQELDGVQEIYNEDSKEYCDRNNIAGQICYHIQNLQHRLVYDEIVDRTDDPPEEGVQRTDDPMEVEPVVRVVPEPHVQSDDEDVACDQFDHRHGGYHDQQYQDLCSPALRIHARKGDKGHDMENAETGSVERKIWSAQKSRVHPFLCLSDGWEKVSIEELNDPSADTAEDKYKC